MILTFAPAPTAVHLHEVQISGGAIHARPLPPAEIRKMKHEEDPVFQSLFSGSKPMTGFTSYTPDEMAQLVRHVAWKKEAGPILLCRALSETIGIYPGVTLIMGASSTGKTYLSKLLTVEADKAVKQSNSSATVQRVAYVEPEDGAITQSSVLADVVVAAMLSETNRMLAIDSFREFAFVGGSNTGKGGVNMSLFTELTRLDLHCRELGFSLLVTLNILQDDDATMRYYDNAAIGSVTSVIRTVEPGSFFWTSRYVEGRALNRIAVQSSSAYTDDYDYQLYGQTVTD